MEPVTVRSATPEERSAVVDLMTLAFAADPACRWLYPGADRYLAGFPRFADAFGGRALTCAGACLTSDGSGASLWLAPGTEPDGDAIEAVVRATVEAALQDRMDEVLEQMDHHHPKEPHWYLAMIGVDPARQGRGSGSALLRHTLARVDEQGLPAYLESSNPANIPLYERHGFEVVAEISSGDSPKIFPMFRAAR